MSPKILACFINYINQSDRLLNINILITHLLKEYLVVPWWTTTRALGTTNELLVPLYHPYHHTVRRLHFLAWVKHLVQSVCSGTLNWDRNRSLVSLSVCAGIAVNYIHFRWPGHKESMDSLPGHQMISLPKWPKVQEPKTNHKIINTLFTVRSQNSVKLEFEVTWCQRLLSRCEVPLHKKTGFYLNMKWHFKFVSLKCRGALPSSIFLC